MEDKIRISYPDSEKVYLKGKHFPNIRVGMRKVNLTPTVTINDKGEKVFIKMTPYMCTTPADHTATRTCRLT